MTLNSKTLSPIDKSPEISFSNDIAISALDRLLKIKNLPLKDAKCPEYFDGKERIMTYLILKGTREDWDKLDNFGFWKEDDSQPTNSLDDDFFLMKAISDTLFRGTKINNTISSLDFTHEVLYRYVINRLERNHISVQSEVKANVQITL